MVKQALIESNGPMSHKDIQEYVSGVRGVNQDFFQIHCDQDLMLVSPNTWGLIGRDVVYDQEILNKVLNNLHGLLSSSKRSIHIDELAEHGFVKELLNEKLTYYSIAYLAQSDLRFNIDINSFISLSSWGGAMGRKTIVDALRQISLIKKGLTKKQIVLRVEEIIGTPK